MATSWAKCKSGALGRRKSAVEDLLDSLSRKLADEPRAWGDRVYVPASESSPLLRFARVGIIMCQADGHEDAAGRFLVALASVEDVVRREPWPVESRRRMLFDGEWIVSARRTRRPRIPVLRRPRMVGSSEVRRGITVTPDDLHSLVAAARYWASSHWPGIAPVIQDIGSRGTCGSPRRATCTSASVRVCGEQGPARSVSGWTWTC